MIGKDKIITNIPCHVWTEISVDALIRTEIMLKIMNSEKNMAYIDRIFLIIALSCQARIATSEGIIPQFVENSMWLQKRDMRCFFPTNQ